MADITLPATATGNVPTPASGAKAFFFDLTTGKFAVKNSAGNYNFGAPWGGEATTASSAAINTVATIITPTFAIPIGSLEVGTTYIVAIYGTCTSTVANASTFTLRLGTTGTVADTAVCTVVPTAAASGTNIPFKVEFIVTVRSIGAVGAAIGFGSLMNSGVTGISATTNVLGGTSATVAVNTTVANFLSVWYSSAAATTTSTFHISHIDCRKA